MTFPPTSETPSALSLPPPELIDAECGEHGAYQARVIDLRSIGGDRIVGQCPACSEARRAAEESANRQRDAVERIRRVESILGRSGIPPRFRDRTFDGYRAANVGQKVALTACRQFAENWPARRESGASMVLTGGPGTGKTHLACAIAAAVACQHLATPWLGSVTQLLRHIKDTYRRDSTRSEQGAINDLVAPDLLIIDEIGVQTGSDHEKMLLFEVLNERYQSLKPTILISNLSGEDLESYIGQRIMDRFRECGSVLAFDWASHRGQRAA